MARSSVAFDEMTNYAAYPLEERFAALREVVRAVVKAKAERMAGRLPHKRRRRGAEVQAIQPHLHLLLVMTRATAPRLM